jgi:choline dehydrogenase-like flavoprotein
MSDEPIFRFVSVRPADAKSQRDRDPAKTPLYPAPLPQTDFATLIARLAAAGATRAEVRRAVAEFQKGTRFVRRLDALRFDPRPGLAWVEAHFDTKVSAIDPVQELSDQYGIPVAQISAERHPDDIETCRFVSSKAEAWVREAGAVRVWPSIPGRMVAGSSHQAGTCRMGNDPKTSVTNRYGQVHDIDNLFLADGSLHVTNGGFNPVLTIMALGYWVSDYITREWKGTKFR